MSNFNSDIRRAGGHDQRNHPLTWAGGAVFDTIRVKGVALPVRAFCVLFTLTEEGGGRFDRAFPRKVINLLADSTSVPPRQMGSRKK
jgi:hypothetical protein